MEESPKRRSTFYVSLDGESKNKSSNNNKATSAAAEYTCNTYPIVAATKTPHHQSGGGVLSRTLSSSNRTTTTAAAKQERQECSGTGGKVHSLTRIFETPQTDKRNKKVERTRSFKTIERFQNRLAGRKEMRHQKETRFNQTIACLETTDDEETMRNEVELRRRRRNNDDNNPDKRRSAPKLSLTTRDSRSSKNNATSFGNLVRRTHSTGKRHGDHHGTTCTTVLLDAGELFATKDSGYEECRRHQECQHRLEDADADAGAHSGIYIQRAYTIYNTHLWGRPANWNFSLASGARRFGLSFALLVCCIEALEGKTMCVCDVSHADSCNEIECFICWVSSKKFIYIMRLTAPTIKTIYHVVEIIFYVYS